MMIPPTVEEVLLQAAKIGLPPIEAEKFFHYYESQGWYVGKRKMVSYPNALMHWKLVWSERQRQGGYSPNGNGRGNPPDHKTWAQREVERIIRLGNP